MNPCPCGYFGHPLRACRCAPPQRERYAARISGPLLDRIDIRVEVPWLPPDVLGDDTRQESSACIRDRVVLARGRQAARWPDAGASVNARLSGRMLRRFARPDEAGRALLHSAVERLALSGRAHDRILRVARSIADLAGRPMVVSDDVAEALQYRMG